MCGLLSHAAATVPEYVVMVLLTQISVQEQQAISAVLQQRSGPVIFFDISARVPEEHEQPVLRHRVHTQQVPAAKFRNELIELYDPATLLGPRELPAESAVLLLRQHTPEISTL